jgi:hypothetical protein
MLPKGHSRHFRDVHVTSAHPPKAATKRSRLLVRVVPKAAIGNLIRSPCRRPASGVAGTSTPRDLAGLRSTGRFHRSPHQQVGGFLALQDIEAPHTTIASHIDIIERRVG